MNVRRAEREWLLRIRAGELPYEDLLKQAEERIQLIEDLFKKSDLPEHPYHEIAEFVLVQIREAIY